MSSLQALNRLKLELDLIQNILKDYSHLAAIGKTVMLCWIPSPGYRETKKLTVQQNPHYLFLSLT